MTHTFGVITRQKRGGSPVTHVLRAPQSLAGKLTTWCGRTHKECLEGDCVTGDFCAADCPDCIDVMRDTYAKLKLWSEPAWTKVEEWLKTGDSGISSKTIVAVMTDTPNGGDYGHPHDPSDFGRCYRLLQRFPEWIPRLGEMRIMGEEWKRLVAHWDELTALYEEESANASGMAPKLYARMKELLP